MLSFDNSPVMDADDAPSSAYGTSSRYPKPLLTDVRAINESLTRRRLANNEVGWWVGQTRPQYEKRFAQSLYDLRVEHFLPLTVKRVFSHTHRKGQEVARPMFPTYVFFAGDQYACYDAKQTGHLTNLLRVADQKTLGDELASLQIALSVTPDLGREPLPSLGDRVEVVRGPFRGLIGYVDAHGTKGRLFLKITMLGEGTPVDIPAEFVEAA